MKILAWTCERKGNAVEDVTSNSAAKVRSGYAKWHQPFVQVHDAHFCALWQLCRDDHRQSRSQPIYAEWHAYACVPCMWSAFNQYEQPRQVCDNLHKLVCWEHGHNNALRKVAKKQKQVRGLCHSAENKFGQAVNKWAGCICLRGWPPACKTIVPNDLAQIMMQLQSL